MKKILAALLCVLLPAGILCACGSQQAPVETTTTASAPAAPADVQAEALYADYLLNGGYSDFLYDYDNPEADFEAEAVLADVNADGVRELLLHITDKSSAGVRGFYAVTILLGVQDGKVRRLGFAEYGGGSGGGDYLNIKYDTVENKHVLEYEEFVRDGMFFNTYALHFFDVTQTDAEEKMFGLSGSGDVVYKTAHTLRCVQIYADSEDYGEDAQRILAETDLYKQEDGIVTAWEYDDAYISEAQYDEIAARFVEPTDPAYQMKPVTLENPIPG